MIKNKNIVLVSNEPWGDIWYSKHNYANELSKHNKVVFVNPVIRWHFIDFFKFKPFLTTIHNGLTVLSYTNILPIRNKFLYKLNNKLVSRLLNKFLIKNFGSVDIFWSFDPYRLSNPPSFHPKKTLFHSVDKYNFVPYGEKELAIKSDFIIGVSDLISDIYQSYNKNVFTIPHGISEEEFKPNEEKVKSIAYNNYFLYVGNIDHRLDYALIKKLIIKFHQEQFLFIGKIKEALPSHEKELFNSKKHSNVIHIDALPFKELKNYIYKARICLAPMDQKFNGNAIAHHKIYQYLAMGKPILGNEFSDYVNFNSLLYMSNDADKIIAMAEDILKKGEDGSLKNKRIALSEKNKFEILLNQIYEKINE